ncbi:sodium-coupled monocarboxylate transporter 1-like isoform X1 [Wyeomyia smithii]|uniref:sodium-coupled monocarboxylate transporter 1-like isoform X1 n=2 Tax=Wyeomyia smithii TaxID=174621 RepID=UPI002467DDB4|nr:sodium-coupled monocarboxylate transporter 1-like isoform X1 [Wyeomyia smithii]
MVTSIVLISPLCRGIPKAYYNSKLTKRKFILYTMEEEAVILEEIVESGPSVMTTSSILRDSHSSTDTPLTTVLNFLSSEVTEALTSTTMLTSSSISVQHQTTTEFMASMAPIATTTATPTVAIMSLHFSYYDYTIFVLMLLLSTLIGVYFGFMSKIKQNNTKEYLLGGKTMSKFPVSASLIASHVSGITLLGVPSELYAHGTQYAMCIICAFIVFVLMDQIYLPVFYDLQLTSAFTYLQQRFDRTVRSAASFVYALSCLIYLPIVIYVPALAFSQVTGINLHLITPLISVVCIFYTTVGGLRAVVWTDTLQFVLMVGATLVIIVLGVINVGGISEVWAAADRGGRLIFFDMNPDPFVRTSFWAVSLGLTTIWVAQLGVSQGCVQRFLAVPDFKVARKSLTIFTFGLVFIKICSVITGLIMYAKYETCDPYTIKTINKLDQMLPYFIMDVGGKIPGMPGLFVSGIFSAALSTMSSVLNTLAGTIYEDFIRVRFPKSSEKTASNVMKCLVILLGVVVIGLVFVVEKLGQVMHMAISLSGITSGTLLGMFTSGMISTVINTKGVIAGSIASVLSIGTIMVGAQMNPKHPPLPFRVDGCEASILHNITLVTPVSSVVRDEVPKIFKLSFMYYAFLGVIIYFVVAYTVSILTGGGQVNDQRLLAPFLRNQKQYEKEQAIRKNNIQYEKIDLALKELQKATDIKQ